MLVYSPPTRPFTEAIVAELKEEMEADAVKFYTFVDTIKEVAETQCKFNKLCKDTENL